MIRATYKIVFCCIKLFRDVSHLPRIRPFKHNRNMYSQRSCDVVFFHRNTDRYRNEDDEHRLYCRTRAISETKGFSICSQCTAAVIPPRTCINTSYNRKNHVPTNQLLRHPLCVKKTLHPLGITTKTSNTLCDDD